MISKTIFFCFLVKTVINQSESDEDSAVLDKLKDIKFSLDQMERDVKNTLKKKNQQAEKFQQVKPVEEKSVIVDNDEDFFDMPKFCSQYFIMKNSIENVQLAQSKQMDPELIKKEYEYVLNQQRIKDYMREKFPVLAKLPENEIIEEILRKPEVETPQIKEDTDIYIQMQSIPPLIQESEKQKKKLVFDILPLYVEYQVIQQMNFILKRQTKNFFNFFKQTKPVKKETYAKINELDIIHENLLRDTLEYRKQLPEKIDDKLTVFLEPEDFLFKTMWPDRVEAYMGFPQKKADFTFEYENQDQGINTLISVYLSEGFDEFLKFLKENTETVIFTRLDQNFFNQVIEHIGKEKFDFVDNFMYQDDCTLFMIDKQNYELCKFLAGLNRNLKKSILLDAQPMTSLFYPKNHLVLQSFHPDQYQDNKQQMDTIMNIIQELSTAEDVRNYIEKIQNNEQLLQELKKSED